MMDILVAYCYWTCTPLHRGRKFLEAEIKTFIRNHTSYYSFGIERDDVKHFLSERVVVGSNNLRNGKKTAPKLCCQKLKNF